MDKQSLLGWPPSPSARTGRNHAGIGLEQRMHGVSLPETGKENQPIFNTPGPCLTLLFELRPLSCYAICLGERLRSL